MTGQRITPKGSDRAVAIIHADKVIDVGDRVDLFLGGMFVGCVFKDGGVVESSEAFIKRSNAAIRALGGNVVCGDIV